jgi:hypothetical protein
MIRKTYQNSVFINCPFDKNYNELFRAIIFAIYDCGFIARCSLEIEDSSRTRIEKIYKLIEECNYGLHDISLISLDLKTKLPRFNMPFELGIFLGAKRFGLKKQKNKNCLIFEKTKYTYQRYISDISGQDIYPHNNNTRNVIL